MKKVFLLLVATFALASCDKYDNIGDELTTELTYYGFFGNEIDTAIIQIVEKNHDDKFDYMLQGSKKEFKAKKGRLDTSDRRIKLITYEKENTYSKGLHKKYLSSQT